MLFEQNAELERSLRRSRNLMLSVMVLSIMLHLLLAATVAHNPTWFEAIRKRSIRITGDDFDRHRLALRTLVLPPTRLRPAQPEAIPIPVPVPAIVEPKPTPPPRQPPPPPPNRVIRPEDVLAENARPDGDPVASKGNTRESRQGAPNVEDSPRQQPAQDLQPARPGQAAQQAQPSTTSQSQPAPDKLAANTNPNALRRPTAPSLRSSAGQIAEAQIAATARRTPAGRTGLVTGSNNGNFSTEPQVLSPNPKGLDFGPYLNNLLNRLRQNWIIPEMARFGQKGRVDIVFAITRSGNVRDIQVVGKSGLDALDRSALSAIQLSNPFQQLPAEYETDLKLRIAFLYNMEP